MEHLKAELAECAATMSLDELEAAINESPAGVYVEDPRALAAYLKTLPAPAG